MTTSTAKTAGKNKKYGRSSKKPTHHRYTQESRWFKNKVRNIVKHMKKFPKYKPYNLASDVKSYVNSAIKKG